MDPIQCKRPPSFLPKAIGDTHVFNFFGQRCLLAALTAQGKLFLAFETADGLTLQTDTGERMDKGPVYRFMSEHLVALKAGAVPASLTSVHARKRSPVA
jgi:hypothetical protein